MPLFHRDIYRHQVQATLLYWGMLPLLVLAPGLALDHILGLPHLQFPIFRFVLSAVCLIIGLGFVICSTRDLQRFGEGTPSPFRPAKRLVCRGSYGLCRHPMFFGYDLVLLGISLQTGSLGTLLATYPLFFLFSVLHLRKEERILMSRFRQSYPSYRQEVPFLIPGLRRRRQERISTKIY